MRKINRIPYVDKHGYNRCGCQSDCNCGGYETECYIDSDCECNQVKKHKPSKILQDCNWVDDLKKEKPDKYICALVINDNLDQIFEYTTLYGTLKAINNIYIIDEKYNDIKKYLRNMKIDKIELLFQSDNSKFYVMTPKDKEFHFELSKTKLEPVFKL